jgi:hypothetical protein
MPRCPNCDRCTDPVLPVVLSFQCVACGWSGSMESAGSDASTDVLVAYRGIWDSLRHA